MNDLKLLKMKNSHEKSEKCPNFVQNISDFQICLLRTKKHKYEMIKIVLYEPHFTITVSSSAVPVGTYINFLYLRIRYSMSL